VAGNGARQRAGLLGGVSGIFSRVFGGRSSNFLALDIGSSAVKLLEIRQSGTSLEVVQAGLAPVPEGAVQNNTVQDVTAVSDVIRRLTEELGVQARQVTTAVPGPAVIIKKARLTIRPEDDLDTLLMLEAANFIPESLDNVSLDYQVLRAGDTEVEVLLVAVRKDILSGYTMAIADAGLEPSIVDVDYFAIENMFELNYDTTPDEVIGLVNIGSRYSSINIIKGGMSSTTGDVQAGGGEITDALVNRLGLSREDAEQVQAGEKVGNGLEDKIQQTVVAGSTELADAINQSLRFLWRTASDEPLHSVYLSGGGARIPGLLEKLAAKLEVPVEIANPFARVQIGRHIDQVALDAMAPSMAIAVGLGTRSPGDS
jgi:type IV pilus assembly protein PilM